MPIYEYQCSNCGHRLEAIQKLSDAPLVTCTECGENGLRKLVSAASFKLKGTGWYVTDFKDKPNTKKTESGKDAPADNKEGTKEGTVAAKPETTPADTAGKKESSGTT